MLTKLRALVLSQDRGAIAPIETVFGISGVASDVYNDEATACKALSKRHFDGALIDCDAAAPANFIRRIRSGKSNQRCPFMLLASNMESIAQARAEQPNLVVHKPVTVSRLAPYMKMALLLMSREYLRYQRYPIERPAFVALNDGRTFQARTINTSLMDSHWLSAKPALFISTCTSVLSCRQSNRCLFLRMSKSSGRIGTAEQACSSGTCHSPRSSVCCKPSRNCTIV